MKPLIYLFLLLFAKQVFSQEIRENRANYHAPIYQFTVKDVNGNDFDFGCLEGKKILIINTASK